MTLKGHLLGSTSFFHGFTPTAAERAIGRLMRAPDGHGEEDDTPPEEEELLLDTPIDDDAPPPAGEDDENDEEEVLVFGDEAEPQDDDTNLVKHLRQQIRDRDRKLAEANNRPEPIVVGEKPTLEGCEYDEDKYDAEMEAWRDRKAKAEAQKPSADVDETAAAAWDDAKKRFATGKEKLGLANFDEAQETVETALSPAQQAALVLAADDPAKLIAALAKNPDRLAALAAETNPIRLAAQIAKLEGTLKVVTRKKSPAPEEVERGSARLSRPSSDKVLDKLEKEAEQTGDRSKVIAYKRKQRSAK